MQNNLTPCHRIAGMLCVTFFVLLTAAQVNQSIIAQNEEYRVVTLTSKEVDDKGIFLQILDQTTGRQVGRHLGPLVHQVEDLKLYSEHVLVLGKLERTALALNSISLMTGNSNYEIWGRRFAFSPDQNFVVYESFYPLHPVDEQVWPTMNLLRVRGTQREEQIIYPEGGYDGNSEQADVKKWFVVSPFLWKEDSTAICVLARYGRFSSLDGSELYLLKVKLAMPDSVLLEEVKLDLSEIQQKVDGPNFNPWEIKTLRKPNKDILAIVYEIDTSERTVDVEVPFKW